MHPVRTGENGEPRSSIRTIVRPSAPRWLHRSTGLKKTPVRAGLVYGGGLLAYALAMGGLVWAAPVAAVAGLVATLGAGLGLWKRHDRNLVTGFDPTFEGVEIRGTGLRILEAIDQRFEYAEKMIHQVPTGLDWSEIESDTGALLWEAAGNAARVSGLDVEIHELRYAERGTPQGALKKSLARRRDDHIQMLNEVGWEAESLARVAGNAAAAAKVALLKTGSLAALEQVTPSGGGLVARGALADARARLELLADVWAQLDDSNVVLAERIDADFDKSPAKALPAAKLRRRNRSPR